MHRAVDADLAGIGDGWAELPTPLVRAHRYRATWLAQDALASTDPFHVLAADPVVGSELADWTLVMIVAHRPSDARGFVLLSHKADPANHDLAAGEELLDHGCSALQALPTTS